MQETNVARVQKDIDEDAGMIEALNSELKVFASEMSTERVLEIHKLRQYHLNRLMFHAFAMTAAEIADENERLMALGRLHDDVVVSVPVYTKVSWMRADESSNVVNPVSVNELYQRVAIAFKDKLEQVLDVIEDQAVGLSIEEAAQHAERIINDLYAL